MFGFKTQHWIPIVIFSKAISFLQKISRRYLVFFSEAEKGMPLTGVIIITGSISEGLSFFQEASCFVMRLSSTFFPFFWKPITLHDNKLTSLQVSFTFTRKLYTQIYRFHFLMKPGHLLLAILTNSGTSRNCHCFQHYSKLQSDVFPFISKVLGSSYI